MSIKMPIVRLFSWTALIPQAVVLGLFALVFYLCLPRVDALHVLIIASLTYLILCRILRAIFTRDHIAGFKAYRDRRFEKAASHFQACHRFFSAHQNLDGWRSALLGVSSPSPYRLIALRNMAFCYGQLGNAPRAIELYEQVLREVPDDGPAIAMLHMLRASAGMAGAAPPVADAPQPT